MERYILTTTIYHTEREIAFYGIALVKRDKDSYELIKAFNDLTQDKALAERLVDNCNRLGLEQIHLKDVVESLIQVEMAYKYKQERQKMN